MHRTLLLLLPWIHAGWALAGPALPVELSIPYTGSYTINSVIVPFEAVDGLIVLQASVNGTEGNFILDTGANGLVLNDNHFPAEERLTGRMAAGLAGPTESAGLRRKNQLQVDALVFTRVPAQTIDLLHLEERKKMKILGLIGYEIIRDFEIMFNYRRSFLTFSELDKQGRMRTPLPHTQDKVDSLSFELGRHLPVVEVRIDGKKKRMGIDSGASYNLLDLRGNKDVFPSFKILKRIDISGTGRETVEGLAGRLYRVKLRDHYQCGAMHTVATNLRNLERVYGTQLDGILGYPFLAPWLISINYRKRQLYFHNLATDRP